MVWRKSLVELRATITYDNLSGKYVNYNKDKINKLYIIRLFKNAQILSTNLIGILDVRIWYLG